VQANIFAGDDIHVLANSVVRGDAISGDDTTLGSGVTIGRIDAGTRSSESNNGITVGANSVVGAMYSSTGVSLGSGVRVVGNTSARKKFAAGSNLSYTGDITSADDVTLGLGAVFTGSIHSGDDVKIGADSAVSGNIYGADKITLGKRSTSGQLHGRDVTIDGGSTVGSLFASHNAKLEGSAVVNGSVNASNDAELKKDSRVNGDVTYGHKIKKDSSAVVTGTIAEGTPVGPTDPNTTLTAPRDWQASRLDVPTFVSGDSDVSIAKNSDSTLTAGNYRKLSVGRGATLTLTAGTYNFANISLDSSVRITADTSSGDVIINSAEDFKMGKEGVIARFGSGNVIISSADDLSIGKNANVVAQFRAYDDLSVDSYGTISGTLYAHEDISLGGGVMVMNARAEVTPEPGTLVLLTVGGMVIASRRRRRKSLAV
jgi:cytoskeletal protein CcmA (bactofilin family)